MKKLEQAMQIASRANKKKRKEKKNITDNPPKKLSSDNGRWELTDNGCFFSSNMSSERFESLQVHKVKSAPVEEKKCYFFSHIVTQ